MTVWIPERPGTFGPFGSPMGLLSLDHLNPKKSPMGLLRLGHLDPRSVCYIWIIWSPDRPVTLGGPFGFLVVLLHLDHLDPRWACYV